MGIVVLGKMPDVVKSKVELTLPNGGTGTLPITFKMRSRKQMAAFEDELAKKWQLSEKTNFDVHTLDFLAMNSSPCLIKPKEGQNPSLYIGGMAKIKSCGWTSLNGSFATVKAVENGYELIGIDTTNKEEYPPEAGATTLVAYHGEYGQRALLDLMDFQAEILLTVISAWGLESNFEKNSVLQLLDEVPNSYAEILNRYREVMRGERRKN